MQCLWKILCGDGSYCNAAINITDSTISPQIRTSTITPGAQLFRLTSGSSDSSQFTQSVQTRQTPLSLRESTAYKASARFAKKGGKGVIFRRIYQFDTILLIFINSKTPKIQFFRISSPYLLYISAWKLVQRTWCSNKSVPVIVSLSFLTCFLESVTRLGGDIVPLLRLGLEE